MQDELIELRLSARDHAGNDSDLLLTIIDRLLSLISDVAAGNHSLKIPPELRAKLTELRRAVSGREPGAGASLVEIAESCIAACEDFFSRAREHWLNREIEFIEIIDALRETVRMLAGQSQEFNRSLIGSSKRFASLLEIDDLQVIKHQIVVETRDLNRMVEEKQKSDRESYSRLSSRIENLQRKLERAEEDAMIDPLTEVANRRSFDESIATWVAENGSRGPCVLAMIDLDDFKKINDDCGHQVGDRVLIGAARMLGKSTRPGDIVARYGGEEFAILLRDCGLERAEQRFAQILTDLSSTRYEYEHEGARAHVRFTASCGLSEFTGGETVAEIVARADDALYEAKRKGKNRVVVRKKSRLKGLFGGKRAS